MSEMVTVPTTMVSNREWFVEDLSRLPPGYRYEIVEGVLYMSPMPELQHGAVIMNLCLAIAPWVEAHSLGRLFPPQTGLHLSKTNYLDPDLLFLRAAEYQEWPKKATRATLVMEVLSPSNTRASLEKRERLFRRAHVEELWYGSLAERTLEIRRLDDRKYVTAALLRGADLIHSLVLPGFELPLTALWRGIDVPSSPDGAHGDAGG